MSAPATEQYQFVVTESADAVDKLNALFYGRFPYPWLPGKFDYLADPDFETVMINQSLGYWDRSAIPENPRIWVAGCGTNQAIFTALKFPKATIIGSDVSEQSLALCGESARQLGISNLELKKESINHVTYRDEFDYVICTGVIHHNADPAATLAKLAPALKENGILELMVYNRFHWIVPIAFQQAVSILADANRKAGFETELAITRTLVNELPRDTLVGMVVSGFKDAHESLLADGLIQPMLHSYTVELVDQMAASCDLEILVPYISQFDKAALKLSWNMEFKDPAVKEAYNALPDLRRWQVTNLLQLEKSPMLWFYLQSTRSQRARKSEREICDSFLDQTFVKAGTIQRSYISRGDGRYELSSESLGIPAGRPPELVKKFVDLADGKTRMSDIFKQLGITPSFEVVNKLRVMLTTPAFPYLKAV